VQLFWDVAPLACENFATLCGIHDHNNSKSGTNKSPSAPIGASGKPLTYQNSGVHRVIPGFILQGGDFVIGNGSGGESLLQKSSRTNALDWRYGMMRQVSCQWAIRE
jgi:cyclophilin family peptidyl-prolyl cis-trans isomerase